MANELDAEIRALYAGARDRFVDERNAFAARLRAAGDAVGAKRVARLKKPTVAAWAIDQVSSNDEATIEELFDAGRRLGAAQDEISTPGGAQRLREIAAARRHLVDELVRTAGRALADAGISVTRATLDKVANTLMAIATDDSVADRVRAGILEKEVPAPSGFGDERLDVALLAAVAELPSSFGMGKTQPTLAERRAMARLERLTAEADRLSGEADELEHDAERMQRAADSKRRQAEAARKKAYAARRRAEEARRS